VNPAVSFAPDRLRAALERGLQEAGAVPARYCIALSGGLDSTVLAAALAASGADGDPALRAIHVDHGLHADSAQWSAHCRQLAERLGVPCEIVAVDARPAAGESPEAAARAARYAALAARLRPREVLLTAHHGDDQLETVLLQWLRGGGLRAVAGMRPVTPFAAGWLARPLLGFARAELEAWARARGLAWLEDPSNADPRFDRNYLRLEILPRLRARWPAAAVTVARVAEQATEALDVAAGVAAADLSALAEGETLMLSPLERLPAARQRLALRAWLRTRAVAVPPAATLEALRRDMLHADGDRIPVTRWPGAVVRRYRGRLYASPSDAPANWCPGRWAPGEHFALGSDGHLELVATTGVGLSRGRLASGLDVVSRPEGGTFKPAGHPHHREVRKWLQEHGVLPWRRAALPFVRAGGEIVAIGDLAYGGTLAAAPGEPSWRIVWHDRPTLTEAEARAGHAAT
jgi:tRNA(Ile)-lysidine synthase